MTAPAIFYKDELRTVSKQVVKGSTFSTDGDCRNAQAITVLSCTRREVWGRRKPRGKTEWVMRGYSHAGEIRLLQHSVRTWALQTGCFCSLLGFFIFAGRCNKVRVRGARGPLIWYLGGRGANINVRLPRAKPMPPRERFYMRPPPAHGPHIMPRHPIKLMSHAEFTRRP